MTRALVLGGGGPVGIAWETGLAVGLAERGIDLARADRIVGTSAGSVVGARLALGSDLAALAAAQWGDAASERPTGGGGQERGPTLTSGALGQLVELMAEAAAWDGPPEEMRARIGAFALAAETAPEESFVGYFADLDGVEWPAPFACTAVHAVTGEFMLWEASSGVAVQRAVASSCAVPGVFPPITIDGHRYVDGGMRSVLNADLVAGHDAAIVVSVMPLGPANEAELATITDAGGALATVEPGAAMLEASGNGMFLMDASRAPAAYQAGLAQAADEAERLRATWM